MVIIVSIWLAIVFMAIACTAVSWLTKDRLNYTDTICGIFSVLLWFIAGLNCLTGIQTDYTTYTAGYLFWVFVAIGIVQALITIVKILDIATARNNETYTTMDHIHL